MKKIFRIIYVISSFMFILYLSLTNPDFPKPPPDALRSNEPADIETTLRRGYFTDLNRAEVMTHYFTEFSQLNNFDISFVTYRLNYPPEEAQTIIRDQTRSTFLEEIVHPFRESIFVNGFEPTEDKDLIRVDGKLWRQKIIIRYYPSSIFWRLIIGFSASLVGILVIENFAHRSLELVSRIRRIKL